MELYQHNIEDFFDTVADGELSKLSIIDVLSNSFPFSTDKDSLFNGLQAILSKVARGGLVTIVDVEIDDVIKAYVNGALDLHGMNVLISQRTLLFGIQDVIKIFEQLGFQVSHKNIVGYKMVVEARRV